MLMKEISEKDKLQFERALPMWRIVLTQFFDHRAAVAGAVITILFVLIAVGAPLIEKMTGLDPNAQDVFNRYQPLMSYTLVSSGQRESAIESYIGDNVTQAQEIQKALTSHPDFSTMSPEDSLYELANKDPKEGLAIVDSLAVAKSTKQSLETIIRGFSTFHLLGTDELGRDVLIRLVYGTRVSMGVGILVALASALIGLIIGSIAGFYGGFVDTALMRITDALLSLPTIPVLIVVAAVDLNKLPALKNFLSSDNESMIKLIFILCLFSWMTVARLVRGSILSIREREFILAARTLGANDSTIILRHMFPNVMAPLLVSVTLGVGESILFEAALSFLGLGIQPPTPSWGNMLFNAQEIIYQAPFLAILPGLLILATTISFNYLGDGLQDAIDPKSIRR